MASFWLVTFNLSNTGTGYRAASRNPSPSTKLCWKTTCDTSGEVAALTPHRRGRPDRYLKPVKGKMRRRSSMAYSFGKICSKMLRQLWKCIMEGEKRQTTSCEPFQSGLWTSKCHRIWGHKYLCVVPFCCDPVAACLYATPNLSTLIPKTVPSTCRSQCLRINQLNLHARGQPIWAQVIVGNLTHMYTTLQTRKTTSDSQCRSFTMSAELNEVLREV